MGRKRKSGEGTVRLRRYGRWDGQSEYRESRGDGLSANTIRHCCVCRRALEKAVAEKLIMRNPAKECNLPPGFGQGS